MLEQAIRHFLEREAHVLVRDLLADDVKRHRWKAGVHRAHDPRQDRAVADASVEHADGRRRRMDVGEFQRDAIGDLGLLAASRDEQEILLPVVEEPEPRRGHIQLRLAASIANAGGRLTGPWRIAGGGLLTDR